MPFPTQSRILLGLLACITIFYLVSSSTSSPTMAGGPTISGLDVTLAQSSATPTTIVASVKNTNTHPVSILTYGSPLDSLAVPLGLLKVTPAGASEPLNIPTIAVRRIWPPTLDMIVTIPPGESASSDIVLKAPQVNVEELGGKATVQLKGKWEAIWVVEKEDIPKESLEKPTGSAEQGEFTSPSLEITVK